MNIGEVEHGFLEELEKLKALLSDAIEYDNGDPEHSPAVGSLEALIESVFNLGVLAGELAAITRIERLKTAVDSKEQA